LEGDAGIIGITHRAEAARVGNDLPQQLDHLAAQIAGEIGDAGDIRSRPRQAGDQALIDGIGDPDEDDGDRRGRAPGGDHRGCGPCQDDIVATAHEIGRDVLVLLGRGRRRAEFDGEVLAFDIAALAHSLAERVHEAFRRP
jgi:hypothetical protein